MDSTLSCSQSPASAVAFDSANEAPRQFRVDDTNIHPVARYTDLGNYGYSPPCQLSNNLSLERGLSGSLGIGYYTFEASVLCIVQKVLQ